MLDTTNHTDEFFGYTIEHFRQKEEVREKWWKYKRRGHRYDSVRSPRSWGASQRHLARTHHSSPSIPVRNSGVIYADSTAVLERLWCDETWSFIECEPLDLGEKYPNETVVMRYRLGNKALNVPQSTQRKIGARGRADQKVKKQRKRGRRPRLDSLYSLKNVIKLLITKGYPLTTVTQALHVPEEGGLVAFCGYRENVSIEELRSIGKIDYRNIGKGGRRLSRQSLELDGIWDELPWFAKGLLDSGSFDLLNMVGAGTIERCGFDCPEIWDRLPLGVKIYFACKDIYPDWRRVEAVEEILGRMRVTLSPDGGGMEFLYATGILLRHHQDLTPPAFMTVKPRLPA